ncbi:hypothetical protein chiPu_0024349, partial [Chiloscyllium punctatum]|nr:hypothetical protein [Chiloscyllium punctatum]
MATESDQNVARFPGDTLRLRAHAPVTDQLPPNPPLYFPPCKTPDRIQGSVPDSPLKLPLSCCFLGKHPEVLIPIQSHLLGDAAGHR